MEIVMVTNSNSITVGEMDEKVKLKLVTNKEK